MPWVCEFSNTEAINIIHCKYSTKFSWGLAFFVSLPSATFTFFNLFFAHFPNNHGVNCILVPFKIVWLMGIHCFSCWLLHQPSLHRERCSTDELQCACLDPSMVYPSALSPPAYRSPERNWDEKESAPSNSLASAHICFLNKKRRYLLSFIFPVRVYGRITSNPI